MPPVKPMLAKATNEMPDGDNLLFEPKWDGFRCLVFRLDRSQPPIHVTPATAERSVAGEWFTRFEGAGFDDVMAKPAGDPYVEDKRTQIKVKHKRTVDCAVAGYRVHKSGDGVGSLLLGLYDEQKILHHIGLCTRFSAARRVELPDEIAPYRPDAPENHPRRGGAGPVFCGWSGRGARLGGPQTRNVPADEGDRPPPKSFR